MRRLVQTRLTDPLLEAVRQDHAAAISELQNLPFAGARVISDVTLADGIATPVAHGLGRAPLFVSASCPRGPSTSGRIEEIRSTSGTLDRRKYAVLKASGFGATITVDVLVV